MKKLSLAITLLLASQVLAADWPQWRGPEFNGSSPEKGLPGKFEKSSAAWVLDMPGPSASTPVIYEDSVYITTPDQKNENAACHERGSENGKSEMG